MNTRTKKSGLDRSAELLWAVVKMVWYSVCTMFRNPMHRDARGLLATLLGVCVLYADSQMVVGAALAMMMLGVVVKLVIIQGIKTNRERRVRLSVELATNWPRIDWVDKMMTLWSYAAGTVLVLALHKPGSLTVAVLLLAMAGLEWRTLWMLQTIQTHHLTCKCKGCAMLQHIRSVNRPDE